MSNPLYNPYVSGAQRSTQGQDGLTGTQAGMDPLGASSHLGSGSDLRSSSSWPSTNPEGMISSMHPRTMSYGPCQSRSAHTNMESATDMHIRGATEEVRILSQMIQQKQQQQTTDWGRDPRLTKNPKEEMPSSAIFRGSVGHSDTQSSCGSSMDWLSSYQMPSAASSSNLSSSMVQNVPLCHSSQSSKLLQTSCYTAAATGGGSSSYTSIEQGGTMSSISGLGDYSLSDQPSSSTTSTNQPKYTLESTTNILKKFGLENEDLELLSDYPDNELTPENLPFILRDIRLQKSKRATAATGSDVDHRLQTSGGVSGSDQFGAFAVGLRQPEESTAILHQPSKVIDYGHSNKHTGGFDDGIDGGSSSRSSGGGNESTSMVDSYSSSSHGRDPPPEDFGMVKYSGTGSSCDQINSVSDSSSSCGSMSPPCLDPPKRSQRPEQTTQLTQSLIQRQVSPPKKDEEGRIQESKSPKPIVVKKPGADGQGSMTTLTPRPTLVRGVNPARPSLVVLGSKEDDGTWSKTKDQGQGITGQGETMSPIGALQMNQLQKPMRPPPYPPMNKNVPPPPFHFPGVPGMPSGFISAPALQMMARGPIMFSPPNPGLIPLMRPPPRMKAPLPLLKPPAVTTVTKRLPTPVMMSDYSATMPRIFPHTCSLCIIECKQMKDWITHQNSSRHIESCSLLCKKYPDWKGETTPAPSGIHSQSGSRGWFHPFSPRRYHGNAPSGWAREARETHGARSPSPRSSRHTHRSFSHSPASSPHRSPPSSSSRSPPSSPCCSPHHSPPSSSSHRRRSRSRSYERRSSPKPSSHQRKRIRAKRLAKRLLKSSAAHSISDRSSLESMVQSLAPALLAELAKMKSSSSSSSKGAKRSSSPPSKRSKKSKKRRESSKSSSGTKSTSGTSKTTSTSSSKDVLSEEQKKPSDKKPIIFHSSTSISSTTRASELIVSEGMAKTAKTINVKVTETTAPEESKSKPDDSSITPTLVSTGNNMPGGETTAVLKESGPMETETVPKEESKPIDIEITPETPANKSSDSEPKPDYIQPKMSEHQPKSKDMPPKTNDPTSIPKDTSSTPPPKDSKATPKTENKPLSLETTLKRPETSVKASAPKASQLNLLKLESIAKRLRARLKSLQMPPKATLAQSEAALKVSTTPAKVVVEAASKYSTTPSNAVVETAPKDTTTPLKAVVEAAPKDAPTPLKAVVAAAPKDATTPLEAVVKVAPKDATNPLEAVVKVAPKDATAPLKAVVEVAPKDATTPLEAVVKVAPKDATAALKVVVAAAPKDDTTSLKAMVAAAPKDDTTSLKAVVKVAPKDDTTSLKAVVKVAPKDATTPLKAVGKVVPKDATTPLKAMGKIVPKAATTPLKAVGKVAPKDATTPLKAVGKIVPKDATTPLKAVGKVAPKDATAPLKAVGKVALKDATAPLKTAVRAASKNATTPPAPKVSMMPPKAVVEATPAAPESAVEANATAGKGVVDATPKDSTTPPKGGTTRGSASNAESADILKIVGDAETGAPPFSANHAVANDPVQVPVGNSRRMCQRLIRNQKRRSKREEVLNLTEFLCRHGIKQGIGQEEGVRGSNEEPDVVDGEEMDSDYSTLTAEGGTSNYDPCKNNTPQHPLTAGCSSRRGSDTPTAEAKSGTEEEVRKGAKEGEDEGEKTAGKDSQTLMQDSTAPHKEDGGMKKGEEKNTKDKDKMVTTSVCTISSTPSSAEPVDGTTTVPAKPGPSPASTIAQTKPGDKLMDVSPMAQEETIRGHRHRLSQQHQNKEMEVSGAQVQPRQEASSGDGRTRRNSLAEKKSDKNLSPTMTRRTSTRPLEKQMVVSKSRTNRSSTRRIQDKGQGAGFGTDDFTEEFNLPPDAHPFHLDDFNLEELVTDEVSDMGNESSRLPSKTSSSSSSDRRSTKTSSTPERSSKRKRMDESSSSSSVSKQSLKESLKESPKTRSSSSSSKTDLRQDSSRNLSSSSPSSSKDSSKTIPSTTTSSSSSSTVTRSSSSSAPPTEMPSSIALKTQQMQSTTAARKTPAKKSQPVRSTTQRRTTRSSATVTSTDTTSKTTAIMEVTDETATSQPMEEVVTEQVNVAVPITEGVVAKSDPKVSADEDTGGKDEIPKGDKFQVLDSFKQTLMDNKYSNKMNSVKSLQDGNQAAKDYLENQDNKVPKEDALHITDSAEDKIAEENDRKDTIENQDNQILEEEFHILDSVDDETPMEDDSQKLTSTQVPETPSGQFVEKEDSQIQEENAYQIVDSVEDQTATEECEEGKKEKTKKEEKTLKRDDKVTKSDITTRVSKNLKKQTPGRDDKTSKEENNAKTNHDTVTGASEKEVDEDAFEIVDSVEDKPINDYLTAAKEAQKKERTPKKDDRMAKIEMATRKSNTPIKDSEGGRRARTQRKEERTTKNHDRPVRRATRASKKEEEETSSRVVDCVDDRPITEHPKRGKKDNTTKKDRTAEEKPMKKSKETKEASKIEEEVEAVYEIVDSVEDEPVEDNLTTTEGSESRKDEPVEDNLTTTEGSDSRKKERTTTNEDRKAKKDEKPSKKSDTTPITDSETGKRERTSRKEERTATNDDKMAMRSSTIIEAPTEEEADAYQIVDSLEDQPIDDDLTSTKEREMERAPKEEDEAAIKEDKPPKKSDTPTSNSESGKREKTPRKEDRMAKRNDKRTRKSRTMTEASEEVEDSYQILDSVEDEPTVDTLTTAEESERGKKGRASEKDDTTSKKEDKQTKKSRAITAVSGKEMDSHQILDSVEDEPVDDCLTTAGGSGRQKERTPGEEGGIAASEEEEATNKIVDSVENKQTEDYLINTEGSDGGKNERTAKKEEDYPDDTEEEELRKRQATVKDKKLVKEREKERERRRRKEREEREEEREKERRSGSCSSNSSSRVGGGRRRGKERGRDKEEEKGGAGPSTMEPPPPSQKDESGDDFNPETLVTLDEARGNEEEEVTKEEQAKKTSSTAKRKLSTDHTEERINCVTVDEVEEEVTTRRGGRPKKRRRQTSVRKSTRGKRRTTKEEKEEEPPPTETIPPTEQQVPPSLPNTSSSLVKYPSVSLFDIEPELQIKEAEVGEKRPSIDASSTGQDQQPQPPEHQTPDGGMETEDKTEARTALKDVSKQRRERVESEAKRSRSQSPAIPADFKMPPFRPNNPIGLDFMVPKMGFFCNLCSVFCEKKSSTKNLHCSSRRHYQSLEKHYQKLQEQTGSSSQGSASK